MPQSTVSTVFARSAALAEIFLVLALGNIVGVAAYEAVVRVTLASGHAGEIVEALLAGLRIVLRIGFIACFGLALLWLRRGLGPRDAGLTRAGRPLAYLVRVGVVLGGFSSFLIALVFGLHTVAPLGEELAAWNEVRQATFGMAFYVDMLVTSIVVPPLVEEIMARGYMRLRLVESYGRIGGVILTGLVFALAHGKFLSTDPLLAMFMVVLIASSIAWAYIAQTTGSLIPSMIAHALTNLFATVVLFHVWIPLAAVTVFVLWQRQPILATLHRFFAEWRADRAAGGLWFGIIALLLLFAALLLAMSQLGRNGGLAAVAVITLAVTIANLGRESRAAGSVSMVKLVAAIAVLTAALSIGSWTYRFVDEHARYQDAAFYVLVPGIAWLLFAGALVLLLTRRTALRVLAVLLLLPATAIWAISILVGLYGLRIH